MTIDFELSTLTELAEQAAASALLICHLPLLLSTAYNGSRVGRVFWSFLLVSAAAMLWPRALWLLPWMWLLMATVLACLTARSFIASLLGLLTPPWLLLPWLLLQNRLGEAARWLSGELLPTWPPLYDDGRIVTMVVWALAATWAASCEARYRRERQYFRLRVRRVFQIFALLPWLLLLWCAAVPDDAGTLLPLTAVASLITSRLWMPSSPS